MLVKDRYGGVYKMPEKLARALILAGTVKSVEEKKPDPVKTRKSKAKEAEAE